VTRTEKIYDDHRKFTLRILYDQAGRPSLWSPSSRLNGVNVTYSPGGHIAGIQRGTMSERMEYDQSGRITSRIFADGKSWSYTYLEKVRVFLLLTGGAFGGNGLQSFDFSCAVSHQLSTGPYGTILFCVFCLHEYKHWNFSAKLPKIC